MAVNNTVRVVKVFDAVAITKNTNKTVVVDVSALIGSTVGKMCFQYSVASAGAADVDITYQLSCDNVTFADAATPMIKENILPAGAGGTATGCAEYDFEFAPFLKIKIAETGNAADVTAASLWLAFG